MLYDTLLVTNSKYIYVHEYLFIVNSKKKLSHGSFIFIFSRMKFCYLPIYLHENILHSYTCFH